MERLTQYDSNNNAESYIAEFDNINIYEGGMEGEYISGRQITRLAEYEYINLTPKEIDEMRDDAHRLYNENNKLKKELAVHKKSFNMQLELIQELKQKSPETAIEVMERYKLLELIRRENEQLKHELEVYKKALLLACDDLQIFDYGAEPTQVGVEVKQEHYIEKARKELEDER